MAADSKHEIVESFSQPSSTLDTPACFDSEEKSSGIKADVVHVSKEEPVNSDDDFPDGGVRAWMIIAGAMCTTFTTFGYVNSWGVFQAYYEQTVLRDKASSDIAWIGSIQYALLFMPSIFVGRLFDLGYFRSILMASTASLVAATFLIPHCTHYWQFILCQGFAVGLPCGCVFAPTVAVIAHWFKKRRGLAMGLNAVGSSLGGTILPIMAKNLIPRVGFAWTMRVIGFVLLVLMGAAILLMKRRLPPRKVAGGLFNWRAFRYAPFTIYCISGFLTFQGLYTFFTFVAVSAQEIGLPGDFPFYFVAIMNGTSLFGRFGAGSVSDRFGPMNVMIPCTTAVGVLAIAWPWARTEASLLAVTILYGLASGAFVSLVSNPAMNFGGPEDVGRRVGVFLTFLAFGCLSGPPISGAIRTATGGFEVVGIVAGSIVLLGVGLMGVARYLALGRFRGRL